MVFYILPNKNQKTNKSNLLTNVFIYTIGVYAMVKNISLLPQPPESWLEETEQHPWKPVTIRMLLVDQLVDKIDRP